MVARDGPGWPGRYLRVRYDPATLGGNCAGAARMMALEQFGVDVPGQLAFTRAVMRGEVDALPGAPVSKPHEGALVLVGDDRNPARHVGLWSEALRCVVHADDQLERVVATPLPYLRAKFPRVLFRRILPQEGAQ